MRKEITIQVEGPWEEHPLFDFWERCPHVTFRALEAYPVPGGTSALMGASGPPSELTGLVRLFQQPPEDGGPHRRAVLHRTRDHVVFLDEWEEPRVHGLESRFRALHDHVGPTGTVSAVYRRGLDRFRVGTDQPAHLLALPKLLEAWHEEYHLRSGHAARFRVEVKRVGDPHEPAPGPSDEDRQLLRTALPMGYFEHPRACSLAELAAALGIEEGSAQYRARRAVHAAVEAALVAGGELEDPPAPKPLLRTKRR